jgi:hypothetical protein
VAATALNTTDLDAVQEAAVPHGRVRDTEGDDEQRTMARIWAPVNGWTVVIWPNWFTDLKIVSPKLSADLGTLASAIDVYDGDFWTHQLWRNGVELDRFNSSPEYFVQDRQEPACCGWWTPCPLQEDDTGRLANFSSRKATSCVPGPGSVGRRSFRLGSRRSGTSQDLPPRRRRAAVGR